ncbi:hypothetical protein SSX86_001142 [Deinandra increscens subsp. villosa]|uniref:Transposase-associated domain-containing protein n=1 Tax=Deinandra increscens subsp. villosa TaxID=3103831 RepID=A0AAP0HE88_9ASTR
MTIDKSWIHVTNRKLPAFKDGLKSFIETCKAIANIDGKAYCPCKKCMNRYLLIPSEIHDHIFIFGFFHYYDFWDKHGEERTLDAESIPYYFPGTSTSNTSNINEFRNDESVLPENVGPIQVWYNNHVRPNPNNADILAVWAKIEKMRNTMRANETREDGSIDDVECLRRVLGTKHGYQPRICATVEYTTPEMSASSPFSSRGAQSYEDVDARVNARVSQQMSHFLDQMRAMNPDLNFPIMPHQSNRNSYKDEDGDEP